MSKNYMEECISKWGLKKVGNLITLKDQEFISNQKFNLLGQFGFLISKLLHIAISYVIEELKHPKPIVYTILNRTNI